MLYAGACHTSISLLPISYTLGIATSSKFGNDTAVNLGDNRGGTTLGAGWVFLFLGSNGCCIGLSNLVGGLVLLINGGVGWGILATSFTFVVPYTLNYLLDNFFLVWEDLIKPGLYICCCWL